MPRRTWLDSKIDVFLEELAASGMHLDRQRAGELISGQVRAVAALMAVTEATARSYLGEEIITDMARRMLFEVAGERPGADLLAAPRTVPLPLALVGITVAALAEAMQVRAANEPPDHLREVITTYAQTLSGFGQITADAGPGQAGDPAEILFPPALLRRAARYISGAADLAANGGKLPAGVPEPQRPVLRRPIQDRMAAGVAAGLARYLDVDVMIVRIAFVVLAVFSGAGIPLYLAGLLLIPEEGSEQSIVGSLLESLRSRPRQPTAGGAVNG